MANTSIKILVVEDSPEDAELNKREVKKVLTNSQFRVVETREEFLRELEFFKPDLILSDYTMPQFDGLTALRLSLEHSPMTPVIIVTGSVNEDTAVECMKAGAANYVIKEQIRRLGPAILHALEEKNGMIEKKKAEEALKISEERFRSYIENAPYGVFLADETGHYQMVNEAACLSTGFSREELLSMSIQDIIFPEDMEIALRHFNTVMETGHATGEIPYRTREREKRIWLVKAVKLNEQRLLGFTHDITYQKFAEAELIAAKEKAEENDRLKTAFLNNISHEVRTPLNGIMGFSSLLNDPKTTSEERDYYVRIINQSGERLVTVITDIVSMAMIETGQEIIRENKFNLLDLMQKVFNTFKSRFERTEVYFNFRSEISSGRPVIISDESKIFQILTNLVGNALKFTSKGTVEFVCSQSGEWLTFLVRDTGIGITPEDQLQIFDHFWKSKPDGSRIYEGTGLGLSICKAYVEMLGGRIWVESEPGQGSMFWFSVPYHPVENEALSVTPSSAAGTTLHTPVKTILVAEDEYDNYLFLEMILLKMKFRIIHVWNGKEAVEICRRNPQIDLILMDLKMPVMNGLDASHEIKTFRPDLPIIAVTAYAMSGDESMAKEAGCDDYLAKPLVIEVLLDKMRQYGLVSEQELS